AASGIDGGADGRLGSLVVGPGTPEARAYPSRFSGVALSENDVIRVEKAGGGGLGRPAARSFESILDDVLDGYVTARAAVAEYGIDPQRLGAALADWERS